MSSSTAAPLEPQLGHDIVMVLARLDPRDTARAWKQLPEKLEDAVRRFCTFSPSCYSTIPFGRYDYFAALEMSDCFDLRGMGPIPGLKKLITLPGLIWRPSQEDEKRVLCLGPKDKALQAHHYAATILLRIEGHLTLGMGLEAERAVAAAVHMALRERKDIAGWDLVSTFGWPELIVVAVGPKLRPLVELPVHLSEELSVEKIKPHLPNAEEWLSGLQGAGHMSLFSRSFTFLSRGPASGDSARTEVQAEEIETTWEGRVVTGNLHAAIERLRELAVGANAGNEASTWGLTGESDLAIRFPMYNPDFDDRLLGLLQETSTEPLIEGMYDLRAGLAVRSPSSTAQFANKRYPLDPLRLRDDRLDWEGDGAREGWGLVRTILNEQNRGLTNHQLYPGYLTLRPAVERLLEETRGLIQGSDTTSQDWAAWHEELMEFARYYELARAGFENATTYYLHADVDGPPGAGPALQRIAMAAWSVGAFVLRQAGREVPDCICIPQETTGFSVFRGNIGSYVAAPRERQQRAEDMWQLAHEFAHLVVADKTGSQLGRQLDRIGLLVRVIDRVLPSADDLELLDIDVPSVLDWLKDLEARPIMTQVMVRCFLQALRHYKRSSVAEGPYDLANLSKAVAEVLRDGSVTAGQWQADELVALLETTEEEDAFRRMIGIAASLQDPEGSSGKDRKAIAKKLKQVQPEPCYQPFFGQIAPAIAAWKQCQTRRVELLEMLAAGPEAELEDLHQGIADDASSSSVVSSRATSSSACH